MIKIGNSYVQLSEIAAVTLVGDTGANILLRSGALLSTSALDVEEMREVRGRFDPLVEMQDKALFIETQEIERRRLRAELDHAELELDREELEERRERRAKQRAALAAAPATPEP